MSNNKTIATNTLFLYFRSLLTMGISIYTSRVILKTLGVDDYGIYNSVGGIVGFLSFINGALSTGSSRFLTFEQGTGDVEKLKKTFSTTLIIHFLLAFFVVVSAEALGYWFIHNHLQIPSDRLDAAYFTFHFSIFTCFFTLTQVPYNASIIAHEKMSVYAYVSVVEAVLKLVICYLLGVGGFDRLKMYAVLLFALQALILCFYRIYCVLKFSETRFSICFDSNIFKQIAGFSGWSLFSNCSVALNTQGILLLLNMFFSPAIVAARAISVQVNMAATQFVNNFRIASNPQIVKLLATGNVDASHALLLQSTIFSYYLFFLLALPIFLLADPLLAIWLEEVPEYTSIFLKLILVQSMFQVFDTSFYTALYAKGQLKQNALISPMFGLVRFPIIYLLFKYGFSPISLSWASLITYAILGLIVKPILIVRICDYTWSGILNVFKICARVTLVSLPLPLFFYYYMYHESLLFFFMTVVICVLSIVLSIWFFGLSDNMKSQCISAIKSRFEKLNHC